MLKGFDTSIRPRADQLMELRKHFDFCGFYLAPAPSHYDRSWQAHADIVRDAGFKMLPIYVGQQVIGPGAKHPSTANGKKDGEAAVDLATEAKFAPKSPIYLDLENGAPVPPKEHEYAFAWAETVREHGYTPGVYCSHAIADHFDQAFIRVWAFKVPTVHRTYATFDQLPSPPKTPWNWNACQYRQNVMLRPLGVLVDLNCAKDDYGLAN